jgi:hypothetical protein
MRTWLPQLEEVTAKTESAETHGVSMLGFKIDDLINDPTTFLESLMLVRLFLYVQAAAWSGST